MITASGPSSVASTRMPLASASVAAAHTALATGSPSPAAATTPAAPATCLPDRAEYRRAIAAEDATASRQPVWPQSHGSPWPTST